VKQSYHSKFCWLNVYVLSIFGCFLFAQEAQAESKEAKFDRTNAQLSLKRSLDSSLKASTSARDLLAQQRVTRVTGVEVKQTDSGLELILKTVAGSKRLVPLILPEGNDLVIDILNATLAFSIRNGVEQLNPAEGINKITVNQVDERSIRLTITGEKQAPSAKVVPGSNLVLSVNPQGTIPQQKPDEEIEVIATGEGATDNYFAPNASTATGTDTPIIETPFSAQVVTQEVIRDRQVVRIEDALNNISGVSSAGSAGGRQAAFNVRGFGNQLGSGTPVLRDGYRLYGAFQAIPEIANLQQVEVLKGPSSILYGQIQPGGVINLVSKQPLAQDYTEAELQIGDREFVRSRFDINIPATDDEQVSARINGVYQHEASFRNFDHDINQISLAPVFKWEISDRTNVTFNLEYIHRESFADFGLTQFGDGVAPVSRKFVTNNPDDTIDTDYVSTGYSFEHRFNDDWKIRNGFRFISYNSDYSVVALPFTVEGANITRFFAEQDGEDRSYSLFTNAVGNFKTGSIKHILTAGIDLNRSESSIFTLFGNPSVLNIFDPDYDIDPKPDRSTLPLFADTLDTANRLGIYLQDQVYLLDNLIFVAGLRYDTVSQTTTNVQTDFTPGGETEQSNDAFTPRLGLLYRPIPAVSLFSNYSQSFEPNTDVTVDGSALEPETGKGFEVGVKTELFKKKLLATLAYFDITKKNVAVVDPNNPLFFVPVGEQSSQGVELDVSGEILPGWQLIGSYAYINAKVTDDTDETIVGNKLFAVPEHKVSLWTTYEIQTGNLQGFGLGLGFEYADNRFGDLANTFTLGDYLIGNAAIFYQSDRYRLAVNFKNFTDANYISAATGNEGGIEPGFPFTLIGSVSVKF
jgi:iron complex outermembrane recepter protein